MVAILNQSCLFVSPYVQQYTVAQYVKISNNLSNEGTALVVGGPTEFGDCVIFESLRMRIVVLKNFSTRASRDPLLRNTEHRRLHRKILGFLSRIWINFTTSFGFFRAKEVEGSKLCVGHIVFRFFWCGRFSKCQF